MSEMVRKQVYLHRRHNLLLKRLAKARGVSEAEIIRQAIDREAAGNPPHPVDPDHSAWDEILAFVATRQASATEGAPYRWHRQDAYEERESRYDHAGRADSQQT